MDFTPYLPIAVGCLVGIVILFLVSGRLGAKRSGPFEKTSPPSREKAHGSLDDAESFANRREKARREGAPVKVLLASPSFKNKTNSGYVLDRSTGGLRIAMTLAMAPGSSLQVKAEHAPAETPWVNVVVRNCRNAGQHFELGCEFDETPPWNVLLLFG